MVKNLLRRPWVQALFAALIGRYLDVALRTTRWTVYGEANLAPFVAERPAVAAFWHERLPLMPAMWTLVHQRSGGAGRACVLVSRHSDGRFIGAVMGRSSGVEVVYGSTTHKGRDRGGAASARALLGVLEAGSHVVITPDGPRGPRRIAAPGWPNWRRVRRPGVCPAPPRPRGAGTLPTWDRR